MRKQRDREKWGCGNEIIIIIINSEKEMNYTQMNLESYN